MKIQSILPCSNTYIAPTFEAKPKLKARDFVRPQKVKKTYAYRDFLNYSPTKKLFEGYKTKYTIPVHNQGILERMKSTYTPEEFENLFDFAKSKGTFDYTLDSQKGTIKTSEINRKENPLMSDLIWVTDTCHNIELAKQKHPEECTKLYNRLAEFYEGQKPNFEKVFASPEKYRENKQWESGFGVGHVFVPKTNKEQPWFPKTRLESLGNYLSTGCDLINEGFKGAEYGYKTVDDVPQQVIDSMINIVKYLDILDYPNAPSCGAWEEGTFQKSLTSDTAIVNEGMRKIIKLVFEPTENQELIKLRERFISSENGELFNDKAAVETLLKKGEKRIEQNHFTESSSADYELEAEWQRKFYSRNNDSAMTFAIQTENFNAENPVTDALAKIGTLKELEKNLVKENGANRYLNDDYLNLDFHTLREEGIYNKYKNEAEWFLVSEYAKAYGSIANNMMDEIVENGNTSQKQKILDYALAKQTEYINRSYARITPKNMTKANGYSCPAYKLPETYTAVTTKKGIKYVPGAHTPLIWAETSLDSASRQFLDNLKKRERLVDGKVLS